MAITKNEIAKIKELVSLGKREDGWTPMASIGPKLNAIGINFKEYGFCKLKPFFESMSEYFIIDSDPITNLPIVKCNDETMKSIIKEDIVENENIAKKKTIHLIEWANINMKTSVEALKSIALEEPWVFHSEDENYPSPILAQYLKWTFVKLMREDKILYANDYASFNTGLVDRFYKPIYAVFDKNRYNKQPWHFIGFCVAGSRNTAARILSDNFSELPQRATYIQKYEDVIYDTNLPVDVNWEHIILDNINRLPIELLRQVCNGYYEIKDPTEMVQECDKQNYYDGLKAALGTDSQRLSLISSMMSMAVETAKLRVAWNYKTAIPVYYPTDDTVHLLLPLALNINEPEEVSIALVMKKTPSGRYRAVTIFTLDMAYSNARLVTKPSSDWLKTEYINPADD